MKEEKPQTLEEKIDYLIQKVEKIDNTINPPLWKTMLLWCWNHLFLLIGIIILGYFTWKIWGIVDHLMTQTQAVQDQFSILQTQVKDTIDTFKFWK